MHTPVLLKESIEALNIQEGGRYIDATYGLGGHSQEIAQAGGLVLGLDWDPENVQKNVKRGLPKNVKKAIESGESFAKWVKLIWEAGTAFGTLRDYITNLSPVIQALVSPIGAVSSQLTELAYRIGVLKRTQADFETGTKTVGERSQDAVNKIQGDIKAAEDAAKLKKSIDDQLGKVGKTGSTGSTGKTTQQQTKELKTFSNQIRDSIVFFFWVKVGGCTTTNFFPFG
jgi:phage-related minor tail protein